MMHTQYTSIISPSSVNRLSFHGRHNVFCKVGTQHLDIIQMKFTYQNVVLAAADRQPLKQRFLISLASLYPGAFCKICCWSDGSMESLDSDETPYIWGEG